MPFDRLAGKTLAAPPEPPRHLRAALVALLVEAGTSSLDNGTGRGEVVHPVGEEDGQKDGNN